VTIRKTPLPRQTLVTDAFPHVDYSDAYRIPIPAATDVDTAVRALATTPPRWLMALLGLRNLLVAPFGIKTSVRGRPDPRTRPLQSGNLVGIFRVYQRSAEEILMGDDDRHLDYRVSVLVRQQADQRWATVSTVVRYNGWLGRAYFLPVRPFHRLIVPALLRQMQRALVAQSGESV
jgi:hypothetical protein